MQFLAVGSPCDYNLYPVAKARVKQIDHTVVTKIQMVNLCGTHLRFKEPCALF